MMLDMLAAIARKDYKDRHNRQVQGIAHAKTEGKYLGRRKDTEKRKIIASLLKSGHSYSEIQATAECSRQLIAVIAKQILKYSNTQILKYSNFRSCNNSCQTKVICYQSSFNIFYF